MNISPFAERSADLPEWYWKAGLHDAQIVWAAAAALPGSREIPLPPRTCFALRLNARDALYDVSVEEIRFYHYKILTPDVPPEALQGAYWIEDRLTREGGKYLLKIILERCGRPRGRFDFSIRFESAEVLRNGYRRPGKYPGRA